MNPPPFFVPRPWQRSTDVYLWLPVAILLLIGCALLQISIRLIALIIMGKNLAVAMALLFGLIVPAICIVLWISPYPIKTLRLRTISFISTEHIAGATISFSVLMAGSFELMLRWGRIPENILRLLEREEMLFRQVFQLESIPDLMTVGLVLVIMAPLAEELLFRGILQGSLERTVGNWPGVIISGLVFGALHGQIRFLPVSLLGLLMGYLVMRTNSLLAGILAHSVNNLTILLLGLLFEFKLFTRSHLVLITALGGVGLVWSLCRFRTITAVDARIVRRSSNSHLPGLVSE